MLVLDGPNAGYRTDPMAWTTSETRATFTAINETRVANHQSRVYIYTDKIFRTDNIIISAYSRFYGAVQDWMTNLNKIMSGIRASVEWTFGKRAYLFKATSFQMNQRLLVNKPTIDYVLTALFSNCRACMNWDGPFRSTFGVQPPTIQDYLGQQ